jgi:hypothetical protein
MKMQDLIDQNNAYVEAWSARNVEAWLARKNAERLAGEPTPEGEGGVRKPKGALQMRRLRRLDGSIVNVLPTRAPSEAEVRDAETFRRYFARERRIELRSRVALVVAIGGGLILAAALLS